MYFNIHHNILDHSSTGNKFCLQPAKPILVSLNTIP
jgi:hypothetical protein